MKGGEHEIVENGLSFGESKKPVDRADKALEAAKVLRDYCSVHACPGCRFWFENSGSCKLCAPPVTWLRELNLGEILPEFLEKIKKEGA